MLLKEHGRRSWSLWGGGVATGGTCLPFIDHSAICRKFCICSMEYSAKEPRGPWLRGLLIIT